jgi:hypothetical protein
MSSSPATWQTPGFTGGDLAAYLDTLSLSSVIRVGGDKVDESVHADAMLPAPVPDGFAVGGDTVTVTVPADSAQILSFSASGSAAGTPVGAASGKCLSATGGSTQAGATTDIYTCSGSASESWTQ